MNLARRRAQAGSAYIIALLALVVLSVLGLGLALVTQTEMQIGSNDRTLQKVFYAADSGIAASTARALVEANYKELALNFKDKERILMGFTHDVQVSPFYPIMTAPCNLCEINDEGEYGRETYKKVNFAVTSVANRKNSGSDDVLASKTLSALVEVQPLQLLPDRLEPITDPTKLAQIKF